MGEAPFWLGCCLFLFPGGRGDGGDSTCFGILYGGGGGWGDGGRSPSSPEPLAHLGWLLGLTFRDEKMKELKNNPMTERERPTSLALLFPNY